MEARLQTRVQRYGWDLAADGYEQLWGLQLAGVQQGLAAAAALAPGERVLDLACGTGRVTDLAAAAVGSGGRVLGVDLSQRMVDVARRGARSNTDFARMDAQQLALPEASFDVVLCSLGLMYLPDPAQALREAMRVLRPGGRLVLSVWGERSRCGWAPLFEIVDAEVSSEVCPLFFSLGQRDALARLCESLGLLHVQEQRQTTALHFADGNQACAAAFAGGPVALAWSRFTAATRQRVQVRYLDELEPWRDGPGFRVPAEFVIVTAALP